MIIILTYIITYKIIKDTIMLLEKLYLRAHSNTIREDYYIEKIFDLDVGRLYNKYINIDKLIQIKKCLMYYLYIYSLTYLTVRPLYTINYCHGKAIY